MGTVLDRNLIFGAHFCVTSRGQPSDIFGRFCGQHMIEDANWGKVDILDEGPEQVYPACYAKSKRTDFSRSCNWPTWVKNFEPTDMVRSSLISSPALIRPTLWTLCTVTKWFWQRITDFLDVNELF